MISRRSCFLILFLNFNLATFTICQKEPSIVPKVLVDISALPKAFTNDDLPSVKLEEKPNDDEICYSFMGCFQPLPIYASHSEPMSLKTTFSIMYKELESSIRVERYDNCLDSNPDECEEYPFDLQQLKVAPFDLDRRTIVIIGGYRSKASGEWERNLKTIWSALDDVNVIIVGWDESNAGVYQTAAANTRPVARQITVLLYYLAKLNGLDLNEDSYTDKFYFIGHSLGAHISGFVGSDLGGRLGRITGLDPAGPSFDSLGRQFRVDRSDARFVDILHTNAGSKILSFQSEYGSALASGHIDLWANNGKHQPGCSNELLGCSHKRANTYYTSFLNDVLSMREYLKDKYKPWYRLTAYASDTFKDFHDGFGLVKRCPITVFDDSDLRYADLAECSIPIDYVAWYSDIKRELEVVHGLNFNETVTTAFPKNYYFYTSATMKEMLDHYMIKIRIHKPLEVNASQGDGEGGGNDESSKIQEGCSIGVTIEMANNLDNQYKFEKYHMVDLEDHYGITLPFLAPGSIPKYELAHLDSEDFFIERVKEDNHDKEIISADHLRQIRDSLDQVFPASMTLAGFDKNYPVANDKRENQTDSRKGDGKKKTEEKKKRSIFQSIKNFFRLSEEEQQPEPEPDSDEPDVAVNATSRFVNCHLPIESFIIQTLRKFRRHLSAVYLRDCSSDYEPNPEVKIILLGANETSPKASLFDEARLAGGACSTLEGNNNTKLYLRTIIIGPLLVVEQPDQPDQPDQEAQQEKLAKEETTMVSTSLSSIVPEVAHVEPEQSDQASAADDNLAHPQNTTSPPDTTKRQAGGSEEELEPSVDSIDGGDLSKGKLWLVLTLLLLFVMVVMILISIPMMARTRLSNLMNRQAMPMTDTNPTYTRKILIDDDDE